MTHLCCTDDLFVVYLEVMAYIFSEIGTGSVTSPDGSVTSPDACAGARQGAEADSVPLAKQGMLPSSCPTLPSSTLHYRYHDTRLLPSKGMLSSSS
jgi:hypothetical protein